MNETKAPKDCIECGHLEESHGNSRIVGCQHGDGSDENPICGCRKMRGEASHKFEDPYEYHGKPAPAEAPKACPKCGTVECAEAPGVVDFEAADRWAKYAHPGIDKGDWEIARAYRALRAEVERLKATIEHLEGLMDMWTVANLIEAAGGSIEVSDGLVNICGDGREVTRQEIPSSGKTRWAVTRRAKEQSK